MNRGYIRLEGLEHDLALARFGYDFHDYLNHLVLSPPTDSTPEGPMSGTTVQALSDWEATVLVARVRNSSHCSGPQSCRY